MIIRDAIHGNIEVTPAEERLIKSKPFLRLKNISQLGFVGNTYPCARHSRYEHSLGVLKCVTDMYKAVCNNCPSFYRDGDLELLRAMALVHDLGHAPFSHASEVLSSIEHEERLTSILEYMKKDIILPNQYDIESWQLVNEVYQGIGLTYLGDKHLMTLHRFLDGIIDADKLDYLQRDSYFCGVQYGKFDSEALVSNLTIYDNNLAILPDGINALESFILARYYMFSNVYTNPDERIRRMLYVKEMQSILKGGKYPDDVKKFITLDDTKYINKLRCINNNEFVLLYDNSYNEVLRRNIERILGDYIFSDTVVMPIFRVETSDLNIWVVDKLTDSAYPCTELSPLLKSMEYTKINKLRFYTSSDVYNEIQPEFIRVLKLYQEDKDDNKE